MAEYNFTNQELTNADIDLLVVHLLNLNMRHIARYVERNVKPQVLEGDTEYRHKLIHSVETSLDDPDYNVGGFSFGIFDAIIGKLQINICAAKGISITDVGDGRVYVSYVIEFKYGHTFGGGSNGKTVRINFKDGVVI